MGQIGVATTGFEDLGIRTLSYRSSQRTRCEHPGEIRIRPPSSSGLGRRPFTAVARVRIPLGVRDNGNVGTDVVTQEKQGPVAQLVSAPPCHGGGRGFESRQGRHHGEAVRFARAGAFRPGSSVGTSVRLKSGRSPVRSRPWPLREPPGSRWFFSFQRQVAASVR